MHNANANANAKCAIPNEGWSYAPGANGDRTPKREHGA